MRLSLAVAAGFGLVILLLGLALGTADRDLTLLFAGGPINGLR